MNFLFVIKVGSVATGPYWTKNHGRKGKQERRLRRPGPAAVRRGWGRPQGWMARLPEWWMGQIRATELSEASALGLGRLCDRGAVGPRCLGWSLRGPWPQHPVLYVSAAGQTVTVHFIQLNRREFQKKKINRLARRGRWDRRHRSRSRCSTRTVWYRHARSARLGELRSLLTFVDRPKYF
jgi:hypothetical protein